MPWSSHPLHANSLFLSLLGLAELAIIGIFCINSEISSYRILDVFSCRYKVRNICFVVVTITGSTGKQMLQMPKRMNDSEPKMGAL